MKTAVDAYHVDDTNPYIRVTDYMDIEYERHFPEAVPKRQIPPMYKDNMMRLLRFRFRTTLYVTRADSLGLWRPQLLRHEAGQRHSSFP